MPGSHPDPGGHAARLGIDRSPAHPTPLPAPAAAPSEQCQGLGRFQGILSSEPPSGAFARERRPDVADGTGPDWHNTWDPSRNALIRTAEEAEALIANTLAQILDPADSPPAGLGPSVLRLKESPVPGPSADR